MNATQINAFRNAAEQMNRTPDTMTAREMALTDHRLGQRASDMAILADGRRFAWVEAMEKWVRYE